MLGIRLEQVAVESPTFPQLIPRKQEIEPQHKGEQHKLLARDTNGWQPLQEPLP